MNLKFADICNISQQIKLIWYQTNIQPIILSWEYLIRGRKAQYIVIHPNDSKCAIPALNLAKLIPQKCLIYKLNLLLIQINCKCKIRQQVEHPELQIRNIFWYRFFLNWKCETLCSFYVLVRCERITNINYEDSNEGFQRHVK